MQSQFTAAINQICDEKNIPKDIVLDTIKAALAAAYKKDFGSKNQEVRVDLDEETSEVVAYISKEVVEEVEDPFTQISVENALKIKKSAKIGDFVEISDIPKDFGRIAAQTAKQVIIQRIREAERDIVFGEYKDKEGEVINGTVQRVEGNNVIIDIGKTSGILFPNEQISSERYYTGQRLKFFVVRVEQNAKGPQIVLSRSHPGLVKRLFELEVPEILAGVVEIKAIAREAGQRTKIAVASTQEGVDPVGSCVGQRGIRVQAVMNEIGEEKIDIILWNEDEKVFIANALSPAKISDIILDDIEKKAKVKVPEDQLSLAIGKQGQNVRLAAKLSGWNVDIEGGDEAGVETAAKILRPVEDKRDLEEEVLKAVQSLGDEQKEVLKGKAEEAVDDVVGELPEVAEPVTVENEKSLVEEKTKDGVDKEPLEETEVIVDDAISTEEALADDVIDSSLDSKQVVADNKNEEASETSENESVTEEKPADTDDGMDDIAEILEDEKVDAS